ncbi:MAG: hypothetical protein JNL50_10790 [Phycisphaerae bacterium]|nr:hypothetical protein [Phycisphaerae bacterium]
MTTARHRRSLAASILALAGSAVTSAALLAPVALAMTPMQTASAQFSFRGPGSNTWQSDANINSRSLERYTKALGFDDDQKAAAKALLEGYQESERQHNNAIREAFKADQIEVQTEGAKNEGDKPKVERRVVKRAEGKPAPQGGGEFHGPDPEAMAKFEATAKAQAEKKEQFFADLKTLLTPAQEGNWIKLERLARRDTGLRFASVSGAGVDLVTMVEKLALPSDAAASAQPLLDQYEAELDVLLVEKSKAQAEFKPGEGPDMDAIKAMMDKQHQAGLKVRDLNRTYASKIAGVLPAEYQSKLNETFKTASFKKAYRDGRTDKLLANAQKLSSLDATQKDKLARIQEQFAKERRAANDKYAEALEKAENDGHRSGVMSFGPLGGANEPKELADAKSARKAIDSKYADQINALLTDQQRAELPPEPQMAGVANFVMDDGQGGQFEHSLELDPEELMLDAEGGEGAIMIMEVNDDGGGAHTTVITGGAPLVAPAPPAKKPD